MLDASGPLQDLPGELNSQDPLKVPDPSGSLEGPVQESSAPTAALNSDEATWKLPAKEKSKVTQGEIIFP